MKKILNKAPGQIAILYAIALTTLAGVIALGADVAIMYVNWQQTQKVADAAAVAGATFLPGSLATGSGITYTGTVDPTCTGQPDMASKVACTYAVKNGLAASTLTITEPTTSTLKVVSVNSGLPYFFAKALPVQHGDSPLSTYTVAASATSGGGGTVQQVNGSVTSGTNLGLLPLGLQCATPCATGALVAGEPVSFGNKFLTGVINNPLAGNWGWVGLCTPGGKTLEDNIANGASCTYNVGDTISTKAGGTNGPINHGLATRFAGCPSIPDPCTGGNPSNIPAGDPCLVVVPAVDFAAATKAGSTNLTILAFAEVYLDPATTDSTHINGCYVSAVAGGTLATTTTTTTSTTTFLGATAPPTLTN